MILIARIVVIILGLKNITSSDNPCDVVLKFLTGKAAEDNVP